MNIFGFVSFAIIAITNLVGNKYVAAVTLSNNDIDENKNEHSDLLKVQFNSWLSRHGKSYNGKVVTTSNADNIDALSEDDDENSEEYRYRLSVFSNNFETVRRHNDAYYMGFTSYSMSLEGPFADLTDKEFETMYLMSKPQNCSATHTSSGSIYSSTHLLDGGANLLSSSSATLDLPQAVDWRTKGVITPIKSQKHCGSCWTFSTTGALEAHHCIAAAKNSSKKKSSVTDKKNGGKDFVDSDLDCTKWKGLAEQQLVDCAGNFNNHGCEGGLPSQAFEYIRYNGGIVTEDMYNYTAKDDGYCKPIDTSAVGARVSDVFNITSYNEDEIVAAVAHVGPVSIAYQVSPDFRFYSHGVYDSFNSTTNQTMCYKDPSHVNHAVVVVGYGDTMTESNNNNMKETVTTTTTNHNHDKPKPSPIPFYIIRNSWGNTWGMEGYFWMIRGQNMCGISDCASFPIVPRPSSFSPTSSDTLDTLPKDQPNQKGPSNYLRIQPIQETYISPKK